MPTTQAVKDSMDAMPPGYVPGPCDVICARGQDAKNHIGNQRYRERLRASLDQYAKATSRHEKSSIVTTIVDYVKRSSPRGHFIKQVDGAWYEVGDVIAREKVGQGLRDGLHDQYRSSTKAKRKRSAAVGAGITGDVEQLIQTNERVAKRLVKLSSEMKLQEGQKDSTQYITNIFTNANAEILEAFKNDKHLMGKFKEAEEQQKTKSSSSSILKDPPPPPAAAAPVAVKKAPLIDHEPPQRITLAMVGPSFRKTTGQKEDDTTMESNINNHSATKPDEHNSTEALLRTFLEKAKSESKKKAT